MVRCVKTLSIKEFSETLNESDKNIFLKFGNRLNLIHFITRTEIKIKPYPQEDHIKLGIEFETSGNPIISRIQSFLIKIIINYSSNKYLKKDYTKRVQ